MHSKISQNYSNSIHMEGELINCISLKAGSNSENTLQKTGLLHLLTKTINSDWKRIKDLHNWLFCTCIMLHQAYMVALWLWLMELLILFVGLIRKVSHICKKPTIIWFQEMTPGLPGNGWLKKKEGLMFPILKHWLLKTNLEHTIYMDINGLQVQLRAKWA